MSEETQTHFDCGMIYRHYKTNFGIPYPIDHIGCKELKKFRDSVQGKSYFSEETVAKIDKALKECPICHKMSLSKPPAD